MNLESVKEEAREIFVEFTNGLCEALAMGRKNIVSIINDAMRLQWLWGLTKSGTIVIQENIVDSIDNDSPTIAIEKLRHYRGIYKDVDLSQIGIVLNPSNPDPSGSISDLLRSGHQAATIGANTIVFSSPLGTTNYTVNVWVIGNNESQYDLGDITKAETGFTVSDAIIEGTLYYQVIVVV